MLENARFSLCFGGTLNLRRCNWELLRKLEAEVLLSFLDFLIRARKRQFVEGSTMHKTWLSHVWSISGSYEPYWWQGATVVCSFSHILHDWGKITVKSILWVLRTVFCPQKQFTPGCGEITYINTYKVMTVLHQTGAVNRWISLDGLIDCHKRSGDSPVKCV